ncbi:MAG: DNA mismatch repair protein MutL [Alphaproteobacteria bacterium CG_4_10_14_0_2_um_filter_63_37]|nr:MAG: DNA mismatch repair protein MutL [Alphaproteobacteria bacterium CG_4_10_14_0_2_um_filter_63_37]
MGIIRLLPDPLVNQIAAGEVVERPASVLKELLENSLDAGADRIEVRVEGAGKQRILIRDNGSGMDEDDAFMALTRHATSKIANFDDLSAIATFGFRGEAIPSIASVSKFTLTTRPDSQEAAIRLLLSGGAVRHRETVAAPVGTTIEVRDLFFNTPARRRFLRADRTEWQHLETVFVETALAHPEARMSLYHDDRLVRQALGRTLEERLGDLMGAWFVDNGVPVAAGPGDLRVEGWVGLPTAARRGAAIHLFVNRRPVRDRAITNALRRAYRGTVEGGLLPEAVLFLTLDPASVDVNVHPTKQEVRFREIGRVLATVTGAVESALLGAGHRVAAPAALSDPTIEAPSPNIPPPEFTPRQTPVQPGFAFNEGRFPPPVRDEARESAPRFDRGFEPAVAPAWCEEIASPSSPTSPPANNLPLGSAIGQIDNAYIVADRGDALVIVDQHAAHERIVLEELRQERREGVVAAQGLLLPVIREVSLADEERLEQAQDELSALGVRIEPMGRRRWVLAAIPQALGQVDPEGFFTELLGDLSEGGRGDAIAERLLQRWATWACHHSVRAGRAMGLKECDAILRAIEQTPLSGQCNHGRPTHVVLDRITLEKLFHRR